MNIESQEIEIFIQDITTELQEFNYYRNKHIPIIQGEERVIELYTRDILYKIKYIIKVRPKTREEVAKLLKNQNWVKFSYSGVSLYGDRLKNRLKEVTGRKNYDEIQLLDMQAEYLEKASNRIIIWLLDT